MKSTLASKQTRIQSTDIPDVQSRTWDVLVVGTGMGGSVLGHELAKSGCSVLFVEKGHSHLNGENVLHDAYAETFFKVPEVAQPKHAEILARAGRYREYIEDISRTKSQRFVPFIGSGTGGSTALYGMALERLWEADLDGTREAFGPEAKNTSLPESWPIRYRQLAPYYSKAERLFRVRGTRDPLRLPNSASLRVPPVMHPANRALFAHLNEKNLNPYRLPVACEYEISDDNCQCILDGQGRKNDAASICLQPAIQQYGAQLLDRCTVQYMESSATRVNQIHCTRDGQTLRLKGRMIVLAAGALNSPCLLLRSKNRHWPQGLSNRSGMVGRNLMRHFIDLYMLRSPSADPLSGNMKELAFNDWYHLGNSKGGTVQSFGQMPPAEVMVSEMVHELRASGRLTRAALAAIARPLLLPILRRLRRSVVMASIIEDPPRMESFVRPGREGEERVVIHYRPREMDLARVETIRHRMKTTFKAFSPRLIPQAENNERIAHACGTCRFGEDSSQSVLNANNRAHDLDNLYVVDSSFFPSSGGTNPGLTIASNALRVAAHLSERLGMSTSQEKEPELTTKEALHALH